MFPIEGSAKHLVVGFGITGLSLVKALKELGVIHIYAMDSRDAPPNHSEIAALGADCHIGGFCEAWLNDCDYLWLSPGVPLATPELQSCLARLPKDHIGGDIGLFARLTQGQTIVGITGTNGKSTVTTLVADILAKDDRAVFVGGNLGEPALNLWLAAKAQDICDPLYVLELSSFQLETTEHLDVTVAAILNLAPDHLDRYRDFDHYAHSKFKLLHMAKQSVVNVDDAYLMDYVAHQSLNTTTFSLKNDAATWHMQWQNNLPAAITNGDINIHLTDISLGGLHNYANVMAACAITQLLGVKEAALRDAILHYQALPHRCALVAVMDGVRYYNDSKATNLPSTVAAIEGFLEPKWLILGGVTKDQDFSELQTLLDDDNMLGVYLIGEDISTITPHIPATCESVYSRDLQSAVTAIAKRAKAGEVVLFSPACASFDQFKSFNDRGEHFERYVHALVKEPYV